MATTNDTVSPPEEPGDRAQPRITRGAGDESAAPGGELLLVAPHDLAVGGVPGDEGAHVTAGAGEHPERRADVWLARGVLHFERLVVHAHVVGRNVEELGPRGVRGRLLVLGPARGRTDPLAVLPGLGPHGGHLDRTARLLVDVRRPVDIRVELFGYQEGAVGSVQRVGEAVAIEVDHGLDG